MKPEFYPLQAADNLKKYMLEVQKQNPKMHFFTKSGKPIAKKTAEYLGGLLDVRTVGDLLKAKENKGKKDNVFSVLQEKTGIVEDYWRGIISHPVKTAEEAEKEKKINKAFDWMESKQAEEERKEIEAKAAFFARIGFSYSTREDPGPDGIDYLHVIAPIGFPEEAQELTSGELHALLSGMSDLVEVALLRKRRETHTTPDRPDL